MYMWMRRARWEECQDPFKPLGEEFLDCVFSLGTPEISRTDSSAISFFGRVPRKYLQDSKQDRKERWQTKNKVVPIVGDLDCILLRKCRNQMHFQMSAESNGIQELLSGHMDPMALWLLL